ncbi:MAG: hypothetical protein IJ532_08210 [Alphaproteobacteria bacterium]|nr:hypothetical protein [Alphaproteobacteria bacterium]
MSDSSLKKYIYLALLIVESIILSCIFSFLFIKGYMKGRMIQTVILIIGLMLFARILDYIVKWNDRVFLLLLMLMFVLVRMILLRVFENGLNQISDFYTVLYNAINAHWSDFADRYYRPFPRKALYPIILNFLGYRSETKIIILQIMIQATGALMNAYALMKLYEKKYGILVGLLCMLIPSQVFYVFITNEEILGGFVVSFVILMAVELLCEMDQGNIISAKCAIVCFVIGGLSGIDSYLRGFTIVVILAFIIEVTIENISRKNIKWLSVIVVILMILSVRFIVSNQVKHLIENRIGESVATNSTIEVMYCADNPKYGGMWNPEAYETYFNKLKENNFDFKKMGEWATNELITIMANNKDEMPALFLNKLEQSYGSNKAMIWWFYETLNKQKQREFNNKYIMVSEIDEIIYYALFLLIVIGSIINIKVQDRYISICNMIVIAAIVINVFITESQARYKSSILAIWFMIASWTIIKLSEYFFKVLYVSKK